MLIAQVNGVSKSFGTHDVLEDARWRITEGGRTALVGRNGAGKTTLFRLLSGELEPDRGRIWRRPGAVIAVMEQETAVDSPLTLRQEAARGLQHLEELQRELQQITQRLRSAGEDTPEAQEWLAHYAHLQERLEREGGYSFESRINAVLDGLGFREDDLDRPLREFSGGQKSRSTLARVLLRDPDLLLLDEPTNHLDLESIEWLESFLKSYRGAYVIVSHDRMFLNRLCRDVVEIRGRRLHRFSGNYDEFLAERERRLEEEAKRYELQRAEILRQEEFIRRNIVGQKTRQAQARRKRLEKLERLEPPEWPASSIRMALPEAARSARNVVEVEGLSKRYGDLAVFDGISFLILRGQKVGLIGPNGVGKSTLVRIIAGRESQTRGRLRVGTGVQIGYFEQEQTTLRGSRSVLEEVWTTTPQATENEIRSFLGGFLFRGDDVLKSLNHLSGGERSRVALAKLVREGANFLVLDEPTNHLDIESREVFEAALAAFAGTVLVVSHDRYFLDRVVDHLLVLESGECRLREGGYSDYAASRGARAQNGQHNAESGEGRPGIPKEKEARRRSYQERKRWRREEEKLRRRLAAAETRVAALEEAERMLTEKMADPAVATDAGRLAGLARRLREIQEQSKEAVVEWERSQRAVDALGRD